MGIDGNHLNNSTVNRGLHVLEVQLYKICIIV